MVLFFCYLVQQKKRADHIGIAPCTELCVHGFVHVGHIDQAQLHDSGAPSMPKPAFNTRRQPSAPKS